MRPLDAIDAELIDRVQHHFPLVRKPYKAIAETLGCTEEQVLLRTRQLVADGIIRDIGPVFNLRALGFASTLVAFKVPSDMIDQASAVINGYGGVSHNYEREGHFNLWFTLTAPSAEALTSTLDEIMHLVRPEEVLDVPVLRTLKIKTRFVPLPTRP
ncbi:MAG: siroheme decarboxylase subunit alpha [Halobacteriota archaeon]